MTDEYETRDAWYEALTEVAQKHDNTSAVRDRVGWTFNWRNETPEEAYYSEYPEHKQGEIK